MNPSIPLECLKCGQLRGPVGVNWRDSEDGSQVAWLVAPGRFWDRSPDMAWMFEREGLTPRRQPGMPRWAWKAPFQVKMSPRGGLVYVVSHDRCHHERDWHQDTITKMLREDPRRLRL